MLREIKTKTEHYFVDENNLKQGEYKDYHDYQFKHLWEHSFRLNDKRHGEYKAYHYNGQLSVHTFYQYGKLHGEFIRYHKNGNPYYATFHYQGKDLNVNPNTLTQKDKTYMLLSGRLPHRD